MFRLRLAALPLAASIALLSRAALAQQAAPSWLEARPGTLARVDIAPWFDSDEPEAALTASMDSSARDFTVDAQRPMDVLYEPVGVLVRIVRVFPRPGVAAVHGVRSRWNAFARILRLVPVVPRGTRLVAAGGFGGFSDLYPALSTKAPSAERLATGSGLVALGEDVAPYDPESADLVRLRVRVISGDLRGRSGWIAPAYTGLPLARTAPQASPAERACRCRLLQFEGAGG
jgi:hypothetical protein